MPDLVEDRDILDGQHHNIHDGQGQEVPVPGETGDRVEVEVPEPEPASEGPSPAPGSPREAPPPFRTAPGLSSYGPRKRQGPKVPQSYAPYPKTPSSGSKDTNTTNATDAKPIQHTTYRNQRSSP